MTATAPAGAPGIRLALGPHGAAVDRALRRLDAARAVERLWARDASLWPGDRAEIAARLGWLDALEAPSDEAAALPEARDLAAWAASHGLTHAAVVGMGGSSLAPELFGRVLRAAGGLAPFVLDSTHPDAVRAADAALDPLRTLFVVSSKSGTTIETTTLARHALARVGAALAAAGSDEAPGGRFAAITDPGSALAETAREGGFRAVFDGPPDVGGRFSALTPFGLVPAVLFGADVAAIRGAASRMAHACGSPGGAAAGGDGSTVAADSDVPARAARAAYAANRSTRAAANPAALLGAAMAAMAEAGRAALTLVVSRAVAPLGDWVEQLVAESTGKRGRGILPVVGEPLGGPERYGPDRLFVHVRLRGDDADDAALARLAAAGHPVLTLDAGGPADLGAQLALWMLATALAGHLLGVQPFDQPDVESAKVRAREALARGPEGGDEASADAGRAAWRAADPAALVRLLADPADYVALLAWMAPTRTTDAALARLRGAIAARTRRPVTVGYGPRYLHSTGQLHKGDAGGGRFVALLAPPADGAEVAVPGDEALSFGRLMRAQADGDLAALRDAGRVVLALRLEGSPAEAVARLAEGVEGAAGADGVQGVEGGHGAQGAEGAAGGRRERAEGADGATDVP